MKLITGATVAAIAALSISTNALAQAAPAPACKALSAEVVKLRKQLSGEQWGSYARSAPQATQLATEIANILSMMRMNLDLMSAHRCAMPTEPVSTSTYMLATLRCSTATLDKAADEKEKCDRSKWLTNDATAASDPKPTAASASEAK